MAHAHGPSAGPVARSIDLQISRLRHKLAEASPTAPLIQTVRGRGYVLGARSRREPRNGVVPSNEVRGRRGARSG